jgi:hypothetical protein
MFFGSLVLLRSLIYVALGSCASAEEGVANQRRTDNSGQISQCPFASRLYKVCFLIVFQVEPMPRLDDVFATYFVLW